MASNETPKEAFKRAYRMVRTAIRGQARQSLKLDLLVEADYSADCRRCNAGAKIAGKVGATLGWDDQFLLCLHTTAIKRTLGEQPQRQSGVPGAMDFDGWIERRRWLAQYREAYPQAA